MKSVRSMSSSGYYPLNHFMDSQNRDIDQNKRSKSPGFASVEEQKQLPFVVAKRADDPFLVSRMLQKSLIDTQLKLVKPKD